MKPEEAIEKIKRVKGLYAYESDYEALDMAIDALKNKLDEHEVWKISSVFQNYFCMGISEIAEEDEVCCGLFEKLGLL